MSWLVPVRSSALERYQRRSFVFLILFAVALFGIRSLREQGHVAAAHLGHGAVFLLAGVCAVPVVGIAICLATYLREEKDEFQRDIEIRGLLAGAAALLVVSVFFSFLHELGWTGYVAPVTEVLTFGMVNAGVKLGYRFRSRVDGE